MREIKFRGWDKEHSCWRYGWLVKLIEGCRKFWAIIVDEEDEGLVRYYIHSVESIGQFTGLKDKNGKEIYEGDILRTRLPARSFQEHRGDNIPFGGYFREPLEPYIEENFGEVVFKFGSFQLKDNEHINYLEWLEYNFSSDSLVDSFSASTCKSMIWNDDEEGELQYLLNEYNLKTEEDLANYMGVEVIGNIYENPELLEGE